MSGNSVTCHSLSLNVPFASALFLCGQTPKVGLQPTDTFLVEKLRRFCVISGQGASFPSAFTCIDLHDSVRTDKWLGDCL